MELSKLYKALVAAGAMLAGGCGSAHVMAARETPQASDRAKAKVNSKVVCHREVPAMFYPDPQPPMEGKKNCCWLMAAGYHECHP